MSELHEADIVLRDGQTLHVRPVTPSDADALLAFLEGLSSRSRVFRFFSLGASLVRSAHDAANVGADGGLGLVGLTGERIVAHATYVPEDRAATAEVAFAVADALQGQGVATILLAQLAEAASQAGIETLTAYVLPQNRRMIEVFKESGLTTSLHAEPGAIRVEMPASLDEAALERFAERERVAARAAVGHVLEPASVAVVGASDREGSIGGAILRRLRGSGFAGRLWAVHPRASTVGDVPAAPTLAAIGEPVELVVVAVRAERVAEVARDAAGAGARALVVISAGFAETGPDGVRRQDELLAICRAAGMRLVGPNCLGVLRTGPGGLDASFSPHPASEGNVGFLSQSGALGIAAMDLARRRGLGLSSFASVGNKADLSGNDFLEYWEEDPRTDVVMLYLESFGNPRKFARIARRLARTKPIVAVKAGRSAAGARAMGSHTGALLSGSEAAVDALCSQAGVIRTDTLGELFDVAALLARQPAPRGPRVALVTNGGGLGILCADACQAAGLDVSALPEAEVAALRALVPDAATLANPIDLLATAPPRAFEDALLRIAASGAVDAIVVLYVATLGSDPDGVAQAIARAARTIERAVPLAAVFVGAGDAPPVLADSAVPCFEFPEEAARAVGRAARYGAWRARPPRRPGVPPAARVDEAAAVIATALGRGGGWMSPDEVGALLACYGIAMPESRTAADPAAAGAAAAALTGPLALKATAEGLVHKTDLGAVTLGLRDAAGVTLEAEAMRDRLTAAGHPPTSFVVQRMVPPGVELLLGVVQEGSFGPVLVCGAGGTAAELEADVAVRLAPLEQGEAGELLRELRCFPLLDGFRGSPRLDTTSLEATLCALGTLADRHPEVAEVEINPLVVAEHGVLAVDARARLRAPAPRPPVASLLA